MGGSGGRRARERGAVVAEAALVLPLLMLLLFGIVEYGVAWHRSNTVASGLGTAASHSARAVGQRLSDYQALQQVRGLFSTAELTGQVRWVMVYRATAADGEPSATCLSVAEGLQGGSTGVANQCNVFSGTAVAGYTPSSFDAVDCTGEPDRWFCPSGRRLALGPTDRLGVAIRYRQPWLTGIFPGDGLTVTDHAVVAPAPEPVAP